MGSKHLTNNILAEVHSAELFSFAVTMSGTTPADQDSIKAYLFPHESFSEAVCESPETERYNKQVEAEFFILRDYAIIVESMWTEQTSLSCAST